MVEGLGLDPHHRIVPAKSDGKFIFRVINNKTNNEESTSKAYETEELRDNAMNLYSMSAAFPIKKR